MGTHALVVSPSQTEFVERADGSDPKPVRISDLVTEITGIKRQRQSNDLVLIFKLRRPPAVEEPYFGTCSGTICFGDGTTYYLSAIHVGAPLETYVPGKGLCWTIAGTAPLEGIRRMYQNPLCSEFFKESGQPALLHHPSRHLPPFFDEAELADNRAEKERRRAVNRARASS